MQMTMEIMLRNTIEDNGEKYKVTTEIYTSETIFTAVYYITRDGIIHFTFSDNPEFWSNASENFAKSAKGNVRALIGPNIRSNSIWNTIEKQTLLNNPNVNSITEINLGD